jgi:hypothetical protein
MRRSRKPLYLYGYREFESHPHRQLPEIDPWPGKSPCTVAFAEFDSFTWSNGSRSNVRNSPFSPRCLAEDQPQQTAFLLGALTLEKLGRFRRSRGVPPMPYGRWLPSGTTRIA